MFRLAEVAAFSIFFVFTFVKTLLLGFADITILTYLYYTVLICFLGSYYLINKSNRINYLIVALTLSVVWLSLIGATGMESEAFGFGKLSSLTLSLLSIPIAVYMLRRNILGAAVVVTTIFILLLTVLFSLYGTYDETDPSYVLNNIYLHGSFLAGFMIFLSFLIRLPMIFSVILIFCLIILGGRGPLLSLLVVSVFLFINFGFRLINRPKLKKRGVFLSLVSFPVLASIILYTIPNLFDRMFARWAVIFWDSGGGDSVGRRIEHIYTSIAAFQANPIFGIGTANYGRYLEGYHTNSYPHNLLLEVLVENGLLGGLPFLVCLGVIFIKSMDTKTWPVLLYVFVCLLMSYSYADSNELYFALTLAVVFRDTGNTKYESFRNHSLSSFGRH